MALMACEDAVTEVDERDDDDDDDLHNSHPSHETLESSENSLSNLPTVVTPEKGSLAAMDTLALKPQCVECLEDDDNGKDMEEEAESADIVVVEEDEGSGGTYHTASFLCFVFFLRLPLQLCYFACRCFHFFNLLSISFNICFLNHFFAGGRNHEAYY